MEFALVVPLLLLLVIGIAELGRAYNAQVSLSGAAREGARVMAVENDQAAATEATRAAAPTLNLEQVEVTPSTCSSGQNATVRVAYPVEPFTGLFGTTITLTGEGVMRCGG